MVDEFLRGKPWPGIIAWGVLYTSDYYLTILSAWLYRTGADKHYQTDKGIELTPYYRKDVAGVRLWSWRFLLQLLLGAILLVLTWWLGSQPVPFSLAGEILGTLFPFAVGALVLVEVPIHIRHFQNLVLFTHYRKSRGVEGQIRISMWLSLRASAAGCCGFTAFFAFLAVAASQWFFAGGAFKCLAETIKQVLLARREEERAAE